ncbi:hypothetical protein FHR92_000468 [Fontibacillus solani]|uniref:Prenylated flavin chaperone LpdD-like domain-containing protein n=1 Tax=Fontibacillus solani TaxID=1572857 RepID=A0A7W3SQ55_9BACL|nr:hypothetical protein [Fontibacillus solani]MBA9084014.1 hypothetical protein [Fontibacillus solani]
MMSFDDITVRSLPMGRDLLIMVTGGEAHIGAASTAYYEDQELQVQTSIVPGHKEHTLSVEMARQAAKVLKRTVTLVMGIHYDNLTKEEIMKVSEIAESKFKDHLEQLTSEVSQQ